MAYQVQLRGKKNPAPIKQVRSIPTAGGIISLKFPCLSVHVTGEFDEYPDSYFTITWSNFYHDNSANPGKFKIQRIENKQPILYVLDSNGRKATFINKWGLRENIVDDISMNLRGDTVVKERVEVWDKPPEAESINSCRKMLNDRFDSLGNDILSLFVSHDLFLNYWNDAERATA
jgi:hypothetical protein